MIEVVRICKLLADAIPVEWDRYTVSGGTYCVAYGWIRRTDGLRDFVLFELCTEEPDNVSFTTSSAKYSKQIAQILYGDSASHNDCIPINKLLNGR